MKVGDIVTINPKLSVYTQSDQKKYAGVTATIIDIDPYYAYPYSVKIEGEKERHPYIYAEDELIPHDLNEQARQHDKRKTQ